MAARLRSHTRCLPDAPSRAARRRRGGRRPAGAAAGAAAGAGAAQGGIGAAATAALRSLAGVHPDALSLAIGDGGNEVGMGRAVLADEIAELSPGGEFAPLRVNGCYRGCDHLVAATVSNWGGTAFEAAACVLCPQEALDYRHSSRSGRGSRGRGSRRRGRRRSRGGTWRRRCSQPSWRNPTAPSMASTSRWRMPSTGCAR